MIKHDALVGMMRDAGVTVVDRNPPPPFDGAALFAHVEAKCDRLSISISRAAKLAKVRSVSTFTRLKHDQAIDANNLVLIMRWLNITDLGQFMR